MPDYSELLIREEFERDIKLNLGVADKDRDRPKLFFGSSANITVGSVHLFAWLQVAQTAAILFILWVIL